jgi:hypothetical protein
MLDDFEEFFGFEPQQVRKAKVKKSLDNQILYSDENPNLNVLTADYFSEQQLKYVSSLFHQAGASINLVYCFSFIANEKKQVSGLAQYFYENVISDLKEWLMPDVPIIAIGRAIYATTFDTDIQVQGFYDSVFNNTFFYSPFVNNRVYPIDTIFKICGFGQLDQKTKEPVYYYDRWETYFAKKQIERAVKAGNCSIARKKSIQHVIVDNPNGWLKQHTLFVPEKELWAAVDSETGGFNKLSDPIGDITISFDGWTAYYLAWKNINPWVFYDFLKAHKIIGANCLHRLVLIDTDCGRIPIGKIVKERLPVKVLSFDKSGEPSYKPIVNYFEKKEIQNKSCYWYNIRFKYKENRNGWSNIRCTADHQLYVQGQGKVQAKNIQIGDCLLHRGGFNDDVLQFIYGSFLGDGSLTRIGNESSKGCFVFSFCHAENQYGYLEWKHKYLTRCGLNPSLIVEDVKLKIRQSAKSKNQKSFYFTSPFLDSLYHEKKINIINKLSLKGLYILFLDDGYFLKRNNRLLGIQLACASLIEDEVIALQNIICRYVGNGVNIMPAKGFKAKGGANKNLYLNKDAANKLSCLFKTVQEEDVIPYKVQGGHRCWDSNIALFPVEVISVYHEIDKSSYRISYDIEVKDNHNFIANGVKSSNCKFDFLFFMFHGVDKDIQISWDTMIAGHLLNEMRSNSLKTHAFIYTNYGGYDLELEKYKWKYPGIQSYLHIPDSIRIPYACMDAAITYQVWLAQVQAMEKEPDLWSYYHKYVLPMLKITTKMEYNGFVVDWNKVTEVGGYIQENIRNALAEVRKAFKNPDLNPNKKQELGKFIESLGWPCINRTKSGVYRVSKKEFTEWENRGIPKLKL